MAQHGDASFEAADRNNSACLNALPDLWAEILKRVPQDDRLRHVPLVSRRFSEACRDPSAWPELRLGYAIFPTEAHWQSFLRWLALRASGLRKLKCGFSRGTCTDDAIGDAWEIRNPTLVALLAASAPQLRSLEHWYPGNPQSSPAAALPAELGRLSQLTSLTLGFGCASVSTEQVNAMVQTLPLLQHLDLHGYSLSDGFPVSIATSCSQLRHLEIRGGLLGAVPPQELGAVPPELGLLTGLTVLDFTRSEVSSLPDSISRLSELRELAINNKIRANGLPLGLSACRQLTRLSMSSPTTSPVLARLHSLLALRVCLKPDQPPHEMYWTQLTALTELSLRWERGDSLDSLSTRLSGMSSLCKLHIVGAAVDDLPAGSYLDSLESLRMEQCVFNSGVPAGLAAASQLRSLNLRRWSSGILLTAADVAILSSMPALVSLTLPRAHCVSQDEWNERLAELKAACAAQGRAPPEITSRGGY